MHEPYRDDVAFTTLRARHSPTGWDVRHSPPYGSFELDMSTRLPLKCSKWRRDSVLGSFNRPVESKTFFPEAARHIGTDNDPASFERAFRKVVQPVPASPKPSVVEK